MVLVGTVSPQHMYGFESTVLMALHGPCAHLSAEHPLHPDEVIAVLSQVSGRRVLDHGAGASARVGRIGALDARRSIASSAPPRR